MDRRQRYILFFLQGQGPGAAGGGRVLSAVPGKGLDSNLCPPSSCSPHCGFGAGGILRWPRAPSCSS